MEYIRLESEIANDKYTEYVYDAFDIQNREKTVVEIPVNFGDIRRRKWNIGLVVGSSGSGKSSILKRLGGADEPQYDYGKAIVSQFPNMCPSDVCKLFTSVGLSSVPVWLRKPSELSFGERARLDIAWHIANAKDGCPIIIDEFTSVVNRDVAKAMSHTFQKKIRNSDKQAIVASCHYDIIEWLKPDWIYNLNKMSDGIVRVEWQIYADDKDYGIYKRVNMNDELSEIMEID